MKTNHGYWLSFALAICSANAGAAVVLTGRTSYAETEATHFATGGIQDGYGYDDSSTTEMAYNGPDSMSYVRPAPFTYIATSAFTVLSSSSAESFAVQSYADVSPRVQSSGILVTSSYSTIETTFTVDTLTHVDLSLRGNFSNAFNASGSSSVQLYFGNVLLANLNAAGDSMNPAASDLSLDLLAGDYRVVSTSTLQYSGPTSVVKPTSSVQSSLRLTTAAWTPPVPVPATGWLLGSALVGLVARARRRKV